MTREGYSTVNRQRKLFAFQPGASLFHDFLGEGVEMGVRKGCKGRKRERSRNLDLKLGVTGGGGGT